MRLQCYEGLDEARALYEWNYKKQLLRIQAAGDAGWEETHDDIFSEEFLLARPLLTAIRRTEPTVLLIDETDKADVEVEGLLLEVLSDFQVTIPELGTIVATRRPFVVLTSNATRELSEALKRRCLYLHLDYPDAEREKAIVLRPRARGRRGARRAARPHRPRAARDGAEEGARASPRSIDWARTLVALGLDTLDEEAVARHPRRRAQALVATRRAPSGSWGSTDAGARPHRRAGRPARVVREALRAAGLRCRRPRRSTPVRALAPSTSSTASSSSGDRGDRVQAAAAPGGLRLGSLTCGSRRDRRG